MSVFYSDQDMSAGRKANKWLLGLAIGIACLTGVPARADIISLIAYVSSALLLDDGITALPYGSIVYIYGDADGDIDPMAMFNECYLPGTATDDDILLGTVRIGQPYYNDGGGDIDGTFLSDMVITWNNTEVNIQNLYIRFFNTLDFTGGEVAWGQSPLYEAEENFLVVEQDFVGGWEADSNTCFVVIPEPSTAHLMLLSLALLAGMGASVRKKNRSEPADEKASKEASAS